MKKKVLVALPERMLDQLDLLAEYRSPSRFELTREILRLHLDQSEHVSPPRPAISLLPRSSWTEAVAN